MLKSEHTPWATNADLRSLIFNRRKFEQTPLEPEIDQISEGGLSIRICLWTGNVSDSISKSLYKEMLIYARATCSGFSSCTKKALRLKP